MSYAASENVRAAPDPSADSRTGDPVTLARGWRDLMFARRFDRLRVSPAPGLTHLGPWQAGWWLPSGVIGRGWHAWTQDVALLDGCREGLAALGVGTVCSSDPTQIPPRQESSAGTTQPDSLVFARLGPRAESDYVDLALFQRGAVVAGLQLDNATGARALGQLQRRIRATGFDVIARAAPRRLVVLREGELRR